VTDQEYVAAPTPAEWRAWLEANHKTEPEVWLLIYKKHTGIPSIDWKQAVVEALCFGWIDGLLRSIDDTRHAQRFTPRRPRSRWSRINRDTAERLMREGLMHPAGFAAVEAAKASGAWDSAYTVPPKAQIPQELRAVLKGEDAQLRARFRAQTVTRHNRWVAWLEQAASESERVDRARRLVESLASGAPLDLGSHDAQ
jgi:uncharacterized protein YdeI (YjbR/CyaY-like superfamily)